MPGVPSSRGCQACRKQKKKCDQSQPACSRCARLQIPCVGAGQQRYKFHNRTVPRGASRSRQSQAEGVLAQTIPLSPGNEVTKLASEFASVLEVTDIRFELRAVYGLFLRDIPARLGMNSALDASVGALTMAFSAVHTRRQTGEMLCRYIGALRKLRHCLNDPFQAASPDTLCALYLLVICQGWIGNREDESPSHGQALAHLLNAMPPRRWQGGFESDLISAMSMLVILESFVNPRIQLSSRVVERREIYGPRNFIDKTSVSSKMTHVQSLEMSNLARIADLIKTPQHHVTEMHSAYLQTRADCLQMEQLLSQIPCKISPDGVPSADLPPARKKIHLYYQTGYGILLWIAIALNTVLQAHAPDNRALLQGCAELVDSVIDLAKQAMQYRPLGSSATPICLIAACTMAADPAKRAEVEYLLTLYQQDFPSVDWSESVRWLEHRVKLIRYALSKARSGELDEKTLVGFQVDSNNKYPSSYNL